MRNKTRPTLEAVAEQVLPGPTVLPYKRIHSLAPTDLWPTPVITIEDPAEWNYGIFYEDVLNEYAKESNTPHVLAIDFKTKIKTFILEKCECYTGTIIKDAINTDKALVIPATDCCFQHLLDDIILHTDMPKLARALRDIKDKKTLDFTACNTVVRVVPAHSGKYGVAVYVITPLGSVIYD